MKQEPDSIPTGQIVRRLDLPHSVILIYLAILTCAGLIPVQRHSRSMIYRVKLKAVSKLVLFLLKDCCNRQPELCTPFLEDISTSSSTSGACCG